MTSKYTLNELESLSKLGADTPITFDDLVEYVDDCVAENYDINRTPIAFSSIETLVDTYLETVSLTDADFAYLYKACAEIPTISRLVA